MFEPSPIPRFFGICPGIDFATAVVRGLRIRLEGQPPQAMSQIQLILNTRRMRRRIAAIFSDGSPGFLPRMSLVTRLDDTVPGLSPLPPAAPPLRRRLQLAQLVTRLLEQSPDLAPKSAAFGLGQSLTALIDEMQSEGIAPSRLKALDVSTQSAHWDRALRFLSIVTDFVAIDGNEPDPEARQRRTVLTLIAHWARTPPEYPVIVAGSTGSRSTTAMLMQAVAKLPRGAVILPGFDFDLPAERWDDLRGAAAAEDHPQYRFARLMQETAITPNDVTRWVDDGPPAPLRNRVVSLALRPAPFTDQWLAEGPSLGPLSSMADGMTLVTARSPRAEAAAIALCLRQALEKGQIAALVSPDRTLSRQVTAALDRWGIRPDDSAGVPLQLTPPGRFLRQIAALIGQKLTGEALLALLKHPLCHSGRENRGDHLRWTRALEFRLRKTGPAFPKPEDIRRWADAQDGSGITDWAAWLIECLSPLGDVGERSLVAHTDHLRRTAERLAGGPATESPGMLWLTENGEAALGVLRDLENEAVHGGHMYPGEFATLLHQILSGVEVRSPGRSDTGIMIWGTLEARVQGADLVILGGLNEGIWPPTPTPDPWMSRRMRSDAGLPSPDRRIGLMAHDFQQAVTAAEVVLTRAVRDGEAETVPSRWLSRILNLLSGLTDNGGPDAIAEMTGKGERLLSWTEMLETPPCPDPVAAPRPSPCPPAGARLKRISVTDVQTLIRDPYAIYAKSILNLRPLDPLRPGADARERGNILHDIMEAFVTATRDGLPEDPHDMLMSLADAELSKQASWPTARRQWYARLEAVAQDFLRDERARRQTAVPVAVEVKGSLTIGQTGVILTGKADRIDAGTEGIRIFDYKSGKPPSFDTIKHFDRQLLLEAAMVEKGAFDGVPPLGVTYLAHIGLGAGAGEKPIPLEEDAEVTIKTSWTGLQKLIDQYQRDTRGFTARRAVHRRDEVGDYDHLARFGEWDESISPETQKVGR